MRQINAFLDCFSITDSAQDTKIMQSHSHTYLVKNITLDQQATDITAVMETLEQHQALSPQYLLTLLTYQATGNSQSSIRTVYNYGTLTLA